MIVFSDVDVVVIIGYSFVGCGLPTILNLLGHFNVGWVIFAPRFRHQYCLLGFRSFPMGCGSGIGLLAVSFGHTLIYHPKHYQMPSKPGTPTPSTTARKRCNANKKRHPLRNGVFCSVELRGIEPRSGDRTLSLLRA